MGLFFGTDGLRGKINDDLSWQTAFRCGNALASKHLNSKILMGRDTRGSGSMVSLAFACGALNGGASVVDVGVCPTAGVCYLTNKHGFDFGVIISASHNPAEFNGIKIVDRFGKKLGDKRENELEKLFLKEETVPCKKLGQYESQPKLVEGYETFLKKSAEASLSGLTIVLDCANGASHKIAPEVFKACGANVISLNCAPDGENINKDCGSLYVQKLQNAVVENEANMGFAFDGDSDRVVAVDESGDVVDGDKIIYLFARHYQKLNKLNPAIVVGTRHSNMGVEKALKKHGINFIRTDIGDKYVGEKLDEKKLLIGGEQSGHIFVKDKLMTGDGVLNALLVACICAGEKKPLSSYFDFELFKQCNINVLALDKMRVINSEKLAEAQAREEQLLIGKGRIMIRVSGTEPYIRVMVETENEQLSKQTAERLAVVVKEINKEFEQCAE